MGTSEEINSDCYYINEVTLTATLNDIKIDEIIHTKLVEFIASFPQNNLDLNIPFRDVIIILSLPNKINHKENNILPSSFLKSTHNSLKYLNLIIPGSIVLPPSPLKHFNAIKKKDNTPLLNPLENLIVITSPTEKNAHRKIRLTDA